MLLARWTRYLHGIPSNAWRNDCEVWFTNRECNNSETLIIVGSCHKLDWESYKSGPCIDAKVAKPKIRHTCPPNRSGHALDIDVHRSSNFPHHLLIVGVRQGKPAE